MHNYWGYDNVYDPWGFIMMFILMVLVVVGVLLGIFYIIRKERHGESSEAALKILKKRYANGEIDGKAFRNIRDDLQN